MTAWVDCGAWFHGFTYREEVGPKALLGKDVVVEAISSKVLTDEADDPISLHNNKHSRKKEAIDLEVDKVIGDKVGCTKESNNAKEKTTKSCSRRK